MKLKRLFTAAAAAAVLLGSGGAFPVMQQASAASPIVFSGISGLPFENGDPFKGADISSVIALEKSGVKFYDRDGKEQDIFQTLAEAGINTIRVRIWNDPTGAQNHATYGGGANDVACAEKIAQRCAAAGLKLFVDFHYSDFWADPGKQRAPKAWENYSVSQKADAISRFTGETLKKLKAAGADIAMVQIGNETTTGMCGVSLDKGNWGDAVWRDLTSLFSAGAKAVRDFDRNILVAVHFTNPEKTSNMTYLADMLKKNNVDYDVFATSYYPYWHGTPDTLKSTLTSIAKTYNKKVLVAETSWANSFENKDSGSNTISSQSDLGNYVSYPVGADGQIAFLEDLFRAVAAVPDGKGIGVFYWEPAWLAINTDDNQRRQLWNQYGGGWATQTAMEYDADAKYYGGSSWENQALFDSAGKPLASLYMFNSVHGDGQAPSVSANAAAAAGGNLMQNPDFELDGKATANPTGWKISNPPADGHLDVRAEDAKNGSYALHWYAKSAFSKAAFETSVKVPVSGDYTFEANFQGSETSSVLLRVRSESAYDRKNFQPVGWNLWFPISVTIHADAGDTITVSGEISGPAECYGSMDQCSITLSKADPVQPAETTAPTKPVTTTTTTKTTITTTATTTTATTTTAATTTVTTTTVTEKELQNRPAFLRGDTNCDASVDVSDAVLLARFVAEDSTALITELGRRNSDCDEDGELSSADVLAILRHIAKLD